MKAYISFSKHFPTVDVRPKVDLADVVVAQHRGVSGVGGVVSSTVVDGAAGGEGQARLQPVLLDEPPGAVLQPLAGSHRQRTKTLISCFPPPLDALQKLPTRVSNETAFTMLPDSHNFISPDVNHGHAGFDPAPDVGAHLPVSLGRLPEVAPHLLVGPVQGALLLAGGPPCRAASGGGGGGAH